MAPVTDTERAIADALFHDQRRRHPGHVLGKRRCEEIVQFVLDRAPNERNQ